MLNQSYRGAPQVSFIVKKKTIKLSCGRLRGLQPFVAQEQPCAAPRLPLPLRGRAVALPLPAPSGASAPTCCASTLATAPATATATASASQAQLLPLALCLCLCLLSSRGCCASGVAHESSCSQWRRRRCRRCGPPPLPGYGATRLAACGVPPLPGSRFGPPPRLPPLLL